MYKDLKVSYTETYADGEYYTEGLTHYHQDGKVIYGGERRGYGVGAMVVQEKERSIVHKEAMDWLWDKLISINENCTVKVQIDGKTVSIDITHQRYQE